MHRVDTSRRTILHPFWLIGLAAAMLVGPTLAITAQAASSDKDHKSTSGKHDKAEGHSAKGSDHADKAADHSEKGADHAGAKQKKDKAGGHSEKGSDGSNVLKLLQKATKAQSDSQDAP